MINLVETNLKDFKKEIYPEYKILFPALERKPYKSFKKTFKNNYTKFLKIFYDETCVGFFILNIIDLNIQIDYFAIFKKYQSLGYGTGALKKLQEKYCNYSLFIEVEKADCGDTEEENITRQKRINFYKKAGFQKIDFDLILYNVIYTPYSFNYKIPNDIHESVNIYLSFYYGLYNKRRIDKYCKYIIN